MHGPERRLAIRWRQAAVRGRPPMGVQAGITGADVVARAPVNPQCQPCDAGRPGLSAALATAGGRVPPGPGEPVSSGLRPDTGGEPTGEFSPRRARLPSRRNGATGHRAPRLAPGPPGIIPGAGVRPRAQASPRATSPPPALAPGGSPAPGAGTAAAWPLPHQVTLPAPTAGQPRCRAPGHGRRRPEDGGLPPAAMAGSWPGAFSLRGGLAIQPRPGRLDSCCHSLAIVCV